MTRPLVSVVTGVSFHVHAAPIKGSRQTICYGAHELLQDADRSAERIKGQEVGSGRFRRAQVVTSESWERCS